MRVAEDFLAPLLEGFADPLGLRRLLPDFFQRSRASCAKRPASRKAGGRMAACACATASTPRSTASSRASTAAAVRALSTAASFSSSADSTTCWRPFTWKIPTSATSPGSAAGRCSTSRAAWSTTNIAAPSASASAKSTSRPCSRRTSCCSAGRIFTSGRASSRTSSSPGPARCSAWSFGEIPGPAHALRPVARVRAIAAAPCASRWRARSLALHRRYRGLPASAGRLFPRPLRSRWSARPSACACCSFRPYPICPPTHGGGVFMYQTLREMARLAEVHVVGTAGLAGAGGGQPGTARVLRLGRMDRAAHRPVPRAAARCCLTPCANSPTRISSGSSTARSI